VAIEVGQPAPDVQLVNYDRKAVKISDLRGKPTVLAFFPAVFTSTCTREMCVFRDNLAKFNTLDAQVIGISVDMPFSQKVFAEANALNFPLMSDYHREAVTAFGVADPHFVGGLLPGAAMRSVFVLDTEGVVRFAWVAPTQRSEPDYAAVEAAVRALGH
jgi:peroxiredoxin